MQLNDPILPFELKIHMDEAGRGPLAGPVWVGAVAQTQAGDMTMFTDSKVLKPAQRVWLYTHLQEKEQDWELIFASGNASAKEIDTFWIIWSIQLASVRAIFELVSKRYDLILRQKMLDSVWWENIIFVQTIDLMLGYKAVEKGRKRYKRGTISEQEVRVDPGLLRRQQIWFLSRRPAGSQWRSGWRAVVSDHEQLEFLQVFFSQSQRAFVFRWLIWDGNHKFGLDELLNCNVVTIIKWDLKNNLIGAASIVAKVERDEYMTDIDSHYPGWNFAKHKWYGTLEHRNKIQNLPAGRQGAEFKIKNGASKQKLTKEHRKCYIHS